MYLTSETSNQYLDSFLNSLASLLFDIRTYETLWRTELSRNETGRDAARKWKNINDSAASEVININTYGPRRAIKRMKKRAKEKMTERERDVNPPQREK